MLGNILEENPKLVKALLIEPKCGLDIKGVIRQTKIKWNTQNTLASGHLCIAI